MTTPALPTVDYRGEVYVLGSHIRTISAGSEIYVVLSDVYDWAAKQGCVYRPPLNTVFLRLGLQDNYLNYTYDKTFGHYPESFCSRQAQIVPISFIDPFLTISGLQQEDCDQFFRTFIEAYDRAVSEAKVAKATAPPESAKYEELLDLVRKLRKNSVDHERAIADLTETVVDLKFTVGLMSSKIKQLESSASPTDAAAELRKGASILYARSKRLEGQ